MLLLDVHDLKPEIMIFNVEVFNALFIAICTHQATSIATSFGLIGVDFIQACLSHQDLEKKLSELHVVTKRMEKGSNEHIRNVFATIISDAEFVRVQSPNTQLITGVLSLRLDLQRVDQGVTATVAQQAFAKNQVVPALQGIVPPTHSLLYLSPEHQRASDLTQTFTAEERHELGQKVLEIMHLTEFLLLVEFVEVMISLVYCEYLCWLGSSKFYVY